MNDDRIKAIERTKIAECDELADILYQTPYERAVVARVAELRAHRAAGGEGYPQFVTQVPATDARAGAMRYRRIAGRR